MAWKALLAFALVWSLTGHALTRGVWVETVTPVTAALVVAPASHF